MARSFVHLRNAGLERFALKENVIDPADLSLYTHARVVVGSTTVYSTASDSGPVRWGTSETKPGEIIALVPTSGFTGNNELASIDIGTGGPWLRWATQRIAVTDASYFGQGGVNREQCQVCGRWFDVTDLIRQIQILRRNARANYLYSSRYNDTNWQVDTDYLGPVSMGMSTAYWKVHPYKNANMAGGAHSFWGDGELVAKDTVDLTSFTTALLRGRFGTHQMTKKPGLEVEFGFYYDYGGGGETRYSFGSKTGIETQTAFITNDLSAIDPGHIAALQAFYKITTYDDQQVWWAEGFRLQKDETAPGMTTAVSKGAPVEEAFLMKRFGTVVVCPDHRMELEKQVNEYEPSFDDVEVVDTEEQEF